MNKGVIFYRMVTGNKKVRIGTVQFTSQGVILDPLNSTILMNLIKDPIRDPWRDLMINYPEEDPDNWIKSVLVYYRSPYLWAEPLVGQNHV